MAFFVAFNRSALFVSSCTKTDLKNCLANTFIGWNYWIHCIKWIVIECNESTNEKIAQKSTLFYVLLVPDTLLVVTCSSFANWNANASAAIENRYLLVRKSREIRGIVCVAELVRVNAFNVTSIVKHSVLKFLRRFSMTPKRLPICILLSDLV